MGNSVLSANRLAKTKLMACSRVSWESTDEYMYDESSGSLAASFFARIQMMSQTGSLSAYSYPPLLLLGLTFRNNVSVPSHAAPSFDGADSADSDCENFSPFIALAPSPPPPPPTPPSRRCSLLSSHDATPCAFTRFRPRLLVSRRLGSTLGRAGGSGLGLQLSSAIASGDFSSGDSSSDESDSSKLAPVNCRYFGCDWSQTRSISRLSSFAFVVVNWRGLLR